MDDGNDVLKLRGFNRLIESNSQNTRENFVPATRLQVIKLAVITCILEKVQISLNIGLLSQQHLFVLEMS